MEANAIMRGTFWIIDWIALLIGTIWATVKYASSESISYGMEDPDVNTFRQALLAEIIFGYLYLCRIWLFVCFSGLIGCVVCFSRQADR